MKSAKCRKCGAGNRAGSRLLAGSAGGSIDGRSRLERRLRARLPAPLRNRFKGIAFAALAALVCGAGCGYHVAGKAEIMPQTVHTIAITPFANRTVQYKLARLLPEDIEREFITRTRYKIVTDPRAADAVLDGAVLNFLSYPIIADQASGRATVVQCSAYLKVTLTERATGKVLFSRPSFEVRERYEISVDPQAYFDESGAGMQRLARDVGRDVVTSILEKF